MRSRILLIASIAWLITPPIYAQNPKYADPDSPATQAAAREALSRAKVLDIVGIVRGIEGTLRDLNAKVTGQEIRIELAADVLFDFDKSDIKPEAAESLTKVAQVAQEYPGGPITIEGHTDGKGTPQYNQRLSEQRAASVKDWLVKNGNVAASRISTRGLGATKPVAPNTLPNGQDNPEGRQKNRRVEIAIRKS